jgi:hypothetical protein
MATPENLVGRLAVLEYGGDGDVVAPVCQLHADTYQIQITSPTIDITNISIYFKQGLTIPWVPPVKDPKAPEMQQFADNLKKRYQQYGTPGQVVSSNLRRARISIGGFCYSQESTPHIGNHAYVVLTRRTQFNVGDTVGRVRIKGIVSDFSIDQTIRGAMKWSCQLDSDEDFDVTQR